MPEKQLCAVLFDRNLSQQSTWSMFLRFLAFSCRERLEQTVNLQWPKDRLGRYKRVKKLKQEVKFDVQSWAISEFLYWEKLAIYLVLVTKKSFFSHISANNFSQQQSTPYMYIASDYIKIVE